MNRIEFCNMLVEARKRSGITISDLSFDIRSDPPSLWRFEKGVHDFNMKKPIEYLRAFGCVICLLRENNRSVVIHNYDTLLNWYLVNRKASYTQSDIAKTIECSKKTIENIEQGKFIMSIDTFLKISKEFSFEISVVNV